MPGSFLSSDSFQDNQADWEGHLWGSGLGIDAKGSWVTRQVTLPSSLAVSGLQAIPVWVCFQPWTGSTFSTAPAAKSQQMTPHQPAPHFCRLRAGLRAGRALFRRRDTERLIDKRQRLKTLHERRILVRDLARYLGLASVSIWTTKLTGVFHKWGARCPNLEGHHAVTAGHGTADNKS